MKGPLQRSLMLGPSLLSANGPRRKNGDARSIDGLAPSARNLVTPGDGQFETWWNPMMHLGPTHSTGPELNQRACSLPSANWGGRKKTRPPRRSWMHCLECNATVKVSGYHLGILHISVYLYWSWRWWWWWAIFVFGWFLFLFLFGLLTSPGIQWMIPRWTHEIHHVDSNEPVNFTIFFLPFYCCIYWSLNCLLLLVEFFCW